jgi:hypothetical protein
MMIVKVNYRASTPNFPLLIVVDIIAIYDIVPSCFTNVQGEDQEITTAGATPGLTIMEVASVDTVVTGH